MIQSWLIVDCDNLCWRTFHGFANGFDAPAQGMVYGFFRSLFALQDRFDADGTVLAFDNGQSLRAKVYPAYKAARKQLASEKTKAVQECRRWIHKLRDDILPTLGYGNVLHAPGYEADDVIASVCKSGAIDYEAVIVSTDKDLWQLLTGDVSIWNHKEMITRNIFIARHEGLKPDWWSVVKAIAGCPSDGIKGVGGIGEKSAVKFLLGDLKVTDRYFKKATTQEACRTRRENEKLTRLPYKGTPSFALRADHIDLEEWARLCKELNMTPVRGFSPR